MVLAVIVLPPIMVCWCWVSDPCRLRGGHLQQNATQQNATQMLGPVASYEVSREDAGRYTASTANAHLRFLVQRFMQAKQYMACMFNYAIGSHSRGSEATVNAPQGVIARDCEVTECQGTPFAAQDAAAMNYTPPVLSSVARPACDGAL